MANLAALAPASLRPRHLLTITTISIVVIGCLAVLSAADGASSGSAFVYFAKAAGFGAAGCGIMVWLGRGGRKGQGGLIWAHRFTMVLLLVGFAGMVFVMLPTPITPPINGAKRWISLPGITIQPSEILKPALALHLAAVLARDPWRIRTWHAMRPMLGICGAALLLIAHQDLGSALVTGGVVMTVLFAAGVSGRKLGSVVGVAALGAGTLTAMAPERVSRLTVFLHPFQDRFDSGFQITNGLMAIGSGGVFGNGIGESLQKHILPEPQTDFILPVIMEEVGFMGATLIMVLYVAMVWLGFKIARNTKDPYERLVAVGLTSIILWQAALNIWVVLGIAPLTGVPLPLISAGGTSQLILLAVIGLLIDIDRRSAMPTVPLVVPTTEPVAPVHVPARAPAAPEPMPGELRVVDQRRPATPTPQTINASRTSPRGATRGGGGPAAGPRASAPGGRRSPAANSPAPQRGGAPAAAGRGGAPTRPQAPAGGRSQGPAPTVVERVAGMEILSNGTVRLPNGRIGRPKSPIALPDGRVLMPDGKVVSRERATLASARSPRPR